MGLEPLSIRSGAQEAEECQVLVPEQIAPARISAFHDEPESCGDVANIDEIESTIHRRGQFASAKIADQPRGRRQAPIAWSDRHRGIRDHDGRALAGERERILLAISLDRQ